MNFFFCHLEIFNSFANVAESVFQLQLDPKDLVMKIKMHRSCLSFSVTYTLGKQQNVLWVLLLLGPIWSCPLEGMMHSLKSMRICSTHADTCGESAAGRCVSSHNAAQSLCKCLIFFFYLLLLNSQSSVANQRQLISLQCIKCVLYWQRLKPDCSNTIIWEQPS